MSQERLCLHEEVLLLALHDETGRTPPGSPYASAVAGGILAELAFRGRIVVEVAEGTPLVRVADATPVGNPLIDECLGRLAAAERPEPLAVWIGRFTGLDDLRHRAAVPLIERGILREEQNGVLLFFTRRGYPAVDMGPEREIVGRLRRAIFGDDRVEPRTVVLLSLARSADLLRRVFPPAELAERRDRIARLVKGEELGETMKEVIETTDETIVAIITAATLPPVG